MTFTRTKPGGNKSNPTTEYSALLRTVRDAGLLRRATTYYYLMFGSLVVALGGVITGMILLGDTWYQLLMAAALGIILTQFAFLAHEASHRQVFESGKANDLVGRMLKAFPGVIKGVKGEFYPCKPDIFEMTYEPAKQTNPTTGQDLTQSPALPEIQTQGNNAALAADHAYTGSL